MFSVLILKCLTYLSQGAIHAYLKVYDHLLIFEWAGFGPELGISSGTISGMERYLTGDFYGKIRPY